MSKRPPLAEDLHRVGRGEGPCHQDRLEHEPDGPLGVGVEPEGVDVPGVLRDVAGEHGDEEGGRGGADDGAGGLLPGRHQRGAQGELDDPGHHDHDIGISREPLGDLGLELLALMVRWPSRP